MTTTAENYRGIVTERGTTVVLEGGVSLPAGTEVLVTPMVPAKPRRGSPAAVLMAVHSEPHLSHEDVEELRRIIHESRADVDWQDPFAARGDEAEGAREK